VCDTGITKLSQGSFPEELRELHLSYNPYYLPKNLKDLHLYDNGKPVISYHGVIPTNVVYYSRELNENVENLKRTRDDNEHVTSRKKAKIH